MLTLKPQDIAVLLKLLALSTTQPLQKNVPSIAALSTSMHLSASEVHAALSRAAKARLFSQTGKRVNTKALKEVLFYGVPYFFPGVKGREARGIPTSTAVPPLNNHFDMPAIPLVWPHALGTSRGYAFEPLYKTIPSAAVADAQFYELLALTDALREGSPRLSNVAMKELSQKLHIYDLVMRKES